ncbi:elongation factor-like GTPase 1 isoform X2 [Daktulosphaira vitifoliae]|uniref:elongation factor-like GTPase 1 isoform X2 n=1 Tax=Daktulosphaira vitifoliae TaxID=58002 RepID=UPI0021AABD96|nr:elongation factor-like GTPase 1 isoform X2 [Daktulosphaira vitifoliae]
MRSITQNKLIELQHKPNSIRNICIMAHVDHGKTTLADSLVASNGVISQKMIGKLRYMDSRRDEQQRGITMKSSSIALYHNKQDYEHLINVIDSPGHIDFFSEVSTALRLCDGAIILVDVVEGVCPQTQACLKQIWSENIKPVLVLNKIDRLILELNLTPLDAYIHITQILEQVNAVVGELFTNDVFERETDTKENKEFQTGEDLYNEWSTAIEMADDSDLYFSPHQGNVLFASAADGWAFNIEKFANMLSTKLGISLTTLKKTLWGDYYLNLKTKRILKGAQEKAKKPLFVQMIIENIWLVYDIIINQKDKNRLIKIADSMNVTLNSRDLRQTDTRILLQSFLSQWIPLATSVLDAVCEICPAPNKLTENKIEKLLCPPMKEFSLMPEKTIALKKIFLQCCHDNESVPVVAFISKMFPIKRKHLPQNRPKVLSAEEIALRREQARIRHALRNNESKVLNLQIESSKTEENDLATVKPVFNENDIMFIAFGRVYSGTIRVGQEIYVLGPKHDPSKIKSEDIEFDEKCTLSTLKADQHVMKVVISDLYMLMGRDLEPVEEVPAGAGNLEQYILKSATLSTILACPPFTEIKVMATPIMRVAIEPKHSADLPEVVKGLKLLNQADACVQVIMQETGEHVIVTAGEVHLQKCIEDLRDRYAKVDVNASAPIVPFRETIVPLPKIDMANEVIDSQKNDQDENLTGLLNIYTANHLCCIKLRAEPLPLKVTEFLEKNADIIKELTERPAENICDALECLTIKESTSKSINSAFDIFRLQLKEALGNNYDISQVWAFGPKKCGPNILLNKIPKYEKSVWNQKTILDDVLTKYENSFVNGFQIATVAGPLCEEPMMGVCFVVEDWTIDTTQQIANDPYGPMSGQIMSAVKDGCRKAFQAQPQRLMAAMYTCSIQANVEVLGKMYAVLGRRHGRVISADMTQGSASNFNITALLPVVESFSFSPEIRKQTSGLASPQLVFSHWEIIDIDPFWVPNTEEELELYGEKADSVNRALNYMNAVRKRKGLSVEEKIVQFAEKQRTLSKNK